MSSIYALHRVAPTLTLTATTTAPAQTVRIQRVRASEDTEIRWGDGTVTPVPANTDVDHTHTYAAAGVYPVSVPKAHRITSLDLREARLGGLNTAQLRNSLVSHFVATAITNSRIYSADMVEWPQSFWLVYALGATNELDIRTAHMAGWGSSYWTLGGVPAGVYDIRTAHFGATLGSTAFTLYTMPAGTYIIDNTDLTTGFSLVIHTMPAGGIYTIDSAAWSGRNMNSLWLHTMPAADTTWSIAAADFAASRRCVSVLMYGNVFARAGANPVDVDNILYGMYLASITPRTATAGTIHIGGTNEAPTGVFQAAGAPVTAATDGKEVAFELLNDDQAVGFNTWATCTITA